MPDIETIEKETDEHVSKSLGVWPLHKRIDLLDKRTAVLQEEFGERLDYLAEQIAAAREVHGERIAALEDRSTNLATDLGNLHQRDDRFARHLGKQGARIGALEERVLHAWPPASDIEERFDRHRAQIENLQGGLAGERRWRNAKADQMRRWLYALAGSQAALAVGLLAEVRWG